jgi:hypothetical protein
LNSAVPTYAFSHATPAVAASARASGESSLNAPDGSRGLMIPLLMMLATASLAAAGVIPIRDNTSSAAATATLTATIPIAMVLVRI